MSLHAWFWQADKDKDGLATREKWTKASKVPSTCVGSRTGTAYIWGVSGMVRKSTSATPLSQIRSVSQHVQLTIRGRNLWANKQLGSVP